MMKKAIWIAFLMVGMAGIGMGNTVTIPGDAWTAYDIPEGGAALQLNINRANNNLVIDDSEIQLQDSSDTVQWSRSSASSVSHVYNIGTVLSSREYLHVFGHYHYTNGVGGGTPPTFNAKVAAPDVDIGALTEEQEESVGVWLPKGGTRTAVSVHAVQCRSPSSSQQTLTWSSGKLSLWTAASGGSMLSGGSYALGADQGATYYAQGDSASGSIRDSEIKTAYTVSGQGTAYDKVKLTVVGATISSFATVLVNATNDVSVTLSPNPPGITNTLQIVCLSGSGSAQFTPSGGTTLDIGQSGTVKIKGVTASSVSNNMLLKAVLDGTVLASNVFTVIEPVVELEFQNSKMATGKVIDPYQPPANVRIGVIVGDTITFKAKLTPNLTLPAGDYVWSGAQSGTGPTIDITFNNAGNYTEGLTVLASPQRVASITAKIVPPPNRVIWAILHPPSAAMAWDLGIESDSWAINNEATLGGGIHNGRADSARHSYWNVLMSVEMDTGTAEEAATAYERTNFEADAPHNEIVMDLENNAVGRSLSTGLTTDRPPCQAAVINALNAGQLTILDDLINANEIGLLKPSNQ